jgi:integration host factor subunit beta
MTKSELIEAIAARANLTKARAEHVVNCVFDSMTEALVRGDGIQIRGFGSFALRPYRSYEGRNPLTGSSVEVPAKRVPRFKVGKELRELVDESRSFGPITQGAGTQGAGTQGAGTQGVGTQGAGTQGASTQGASAQGAGRGKKPRDE